MADCARQGRRRNSLLVRARDRRQAPSEDAQMTVFFRFPHTPHIAWNGVGRPRDDKVLSPCEIRELLGHEVVVEEKIDGANLGFSVDEHGILRAQNRGSYLSVDEDRGQWKPLKR